MTEDFQSDKRTKLISELWRFLAPFETPQYSDVIFIFGGVSLKVPNLAADLFLAGYAPRIVISGGAGARTHLHFSGAESDVFADVVLGKGVPPDAVIFEREATNTGENVALGMGALLRVAPRPKKVILVATPFIMRRCIATFRKQYPGIETIPVPPAGDFAQHMDRPEGEFVARLIAEIDRLDDYAAAGYIDAVQIPPAVRAACNNLRSE